jgi:peptide/nickel transport system permease protein
MLRFTVWRLLQSIPVTLAVVVLSFFLIRAAPGDPVLLLAGQHSPSPKFVEEIRRQYGLDRPMIVQLGRYLERVLRGDLGRSISFGAPVLSVVLERFPPTLLLITSATVFSLAAGTVLGSVAACRRGSLLAAAVSTVSVVAWALPVFWLAQLLMLVFAVWLGWFPTSGFMSLREEREGLARLLDIGHHLFLPALTVFLLRLAVTAKLARTSMVTALGEHYVTTARAKGLAERRVVLVHALRNAIPPVVTMTGTGFGTLIAGTVLTETVFAYPGLGRLMFDAILARDQPLLLGVFIAVSVFIVVVNLLSDLVHALVDPRVRIA